MNTDLVDFHYCGPGGVIPARIPPASVYGFQPLTAIEIGQFMVQGQVMAQGIVGVAAPPPVVPPPPAPAPAVAPGAAPVAPDSWVAMEQVGPFKRGDVVVTDPNPLPPGHVILGDRAIIPAGTEHVVIKRMIAAEAVSFALEDLRVLPVHFDSEGTRRREFNLCVEKFRGDAPQGGGLQLSGPPTCLNFMKGLRDQGFTPTTFHEHWIRSSDIPKGDRSTYEHECLARILEALVCVDQINVPALQGVELICRRMMVIREAHRISPSSPDYSASDHYMGWKFRRSGPGIDTDLAAHVASELKAEAAIAKESRKAREEQNMRRNNTRPKAQKGSEGGQDK